MVRGKLMNTIPPFLLFPNARRSFAWHLLTETNEHFPLALYIYLYIFLHSPLLRLVPPLSWTQTSLIRSLASRDLDRFGEPMALPSARRSPTSRATTTSAFSLSVSPPPVSLPPSLDLALTLSSPLPILPSSRSRPWVAPSLLTR